MATLIFEVAQELAQEAINTIQFERVGQNRYVVSGLYDDPYIFVEDRVSASPDQIRRVASLVSLLVNKYVKETYHIDGKPLVQMDRPVKMSKVLKSVPIRLAVDPPNDEDTELESETELTPEEVQRQTSELVSRTTGGMPEDIQAIFKATPQTKWPLLNVLFDEDPDLVLEYAKAPPETKAQMEDFYGQVLYKKPEPGSEEEAEELARETEPEEFPEEGVIPGEEDILNKLSSDNLDDDTFNELMLYWGNIQKDLGYDPFGESFGDETALMEDDVVLLDDEPDPEDMPKHIAAFANFQNMRQVYKGEESTEAARRERERASNIIKERNKDFPSWYSSAGNIMGFAHEAPLLYSMYYSGWVNPDKTIHNYYKAEVPDPRTAASYVTDLFAVGATPNEVVAFLNGWNNELKMSRTADDPIRKHQMIVSAAIDAANHAEAYLAKEPDVEESKFKRAYGVDFNERLLKLDRTFAILDRLMTSPRQRNPEVILGWYAYNFPSRYDTAIQKVIAVNEARKKMKEGLPVPDILPAWRHEIRVTKALPIPRENISVDILPEDTPEQKKAKQLLKSKLNSKELIQSTIDSIGDIMSPYSEQTNEILNERRRVDVDAILSAPLEVLPVWSSMPPGTNITVAGEPYIYRGFGRNQYEVSPTDDPSKIIPVEKEVIDNAEKDVPQELKEMWAEEAEERQHKWEEKKTELPVTPKVTQVEEKGVPRRHMLPEEKQWLPKAKKFTDIGNDYLNLFAKGIESINYTEEPGKPKVTERSFAVNNLPLAEFPMSGPEGELIVTVEDVVTRLRNLANIGVIDPNAIEKFKLHITGPTKRIISELPDELESSFNTSSGEMTISVDSIPRMMNKLKDMPPGYRVDRIDIDITKPSNVSKLDITLPDGEHKTLKFADPTAAAYFLYELKGVITDEQKKKTIPQFVYGLSPTEVEKATESGLFKNIPAFVTELKDKGTSDDEIAKLVREKVIQGYEEAKPTAIQREEPTLEPKGKDREPIKQLLRDIQKDFVAITHPKQDLVWGTSGRPSLIVTTKDPKGDDHKTCIRFDNPTQLNKFLEEVSDYPSAQGKELPKPIFTKEKGVERTKAEQETFVDTIWNIFKDDYKLVQRQPEKIPSFKYQLVDMLRTNPVMQSRVEETTGMSRTELRDKLIQLFGEGSITKSSSKIIPIRFVSKMIKKAIKGSIKRVGKFMPIKYIQRISY